MVLMAAAAAPDTDKPSPSAPALMSSLSPASAAAAGTARSRTRLHDFSFPTLSWGTHRLLRCSKDGASHYTPPQNPHIPSLGKEKPQDSAGSGASQPQRPWNLRIRRSGTAAPLASKSEAAGKVSAASGQRLQSPTTPPTRKRGFSLALTKEEIAEDFIAIRGALPPRRPKKRSRAVQRKLDELFPELSLNDVNLDSYKIDES